MLDCDQTSVQHILYNSALVTVLMINFAGGQEQEEYSSTHEHSTVV